jgi:hypothetical protein
LVNRGEVAFAKFLDWFELSMETSLVEQSTQMHSHYTESGLVGAVQLNGVILVSEEVETNFFALGFVLNKNSAYMFLELYFEDEFSSIKYTELFVRNNLCVFGWN